MTRLTIYMRDAFVQAVLDDVPTIDYDEQARAIAQKWAISQIPAKLRVLHKEHPDWFKTETLDMPGRLNNCGIVTNLGWSDLTKATKADKTFWDSLQALASQKHAQLNSRKDLETKVKSAISMCSTVKQAHEKLPEFAKYLPEPDAPQDRSVPVIANLVSDLTAAGWPKDKKKAQMRKAAA